MTSGGRIRGRPDAMASVELPVSYCWPLRLARRQTDRRSGSLFRHSGPSCARPNPSPPIRSTRSHLVARQRIVRRESRLTNVKQGWAGLATGGRFGLRDNALSPVSFQRPTIGRSPYRTIGTARGTLPASRVACSLSREPSPTIPSIPAVAGREAEHLTVHPLHPRPFGGKSENRAKGTGALPYGWCQLFQDRC